MADSPNRYTDIEQLEGIYEVSFYCVRCYYNFQTHELWGMNNFHERLITVAIHFHNILATITEYIIPGWYCAGFPLKIIRKCLVVKRPFNHHPSQEKVYSNE